MQVERIQMLAAEAERRGLPMPDHIRRHLALREAQRRGLRLSSSFREYVEEVNPTMLRFEHAETMIRVGQQLIDGEITRLLVLMPPRYLKTETFGRLLGSYAMREFPHQSVGLGSYASSLAWETSEAARDYYTMSGGQLRASASAKKFWGTPEGGDFWAIGVDSGSLGRGFHIGIVDDPVDPEKVRSAVFQQRFERWWVQKFLSRKEPNARLVFVMQRLGADDPVDFLFRREVGEHTDLAPQYWHVLVMDEVKSSEPLGRWDGPQGLPATCTIIDDPRPEGAVLAPSRFSQEEVERTHREMGSYVTVTQRQQRPLRPQGDFWKKDWFIHTYDELPATAYNGGKDWDTAYTENERNSASAYCESYRGPTYKRTDDREVFDIYIHDASWQWLEFPELVAWMQELGGPHYVEAKASGKSLAQSLRAEGVVATEVLMSGSKFTRSVAVQPTVSVGRVWIRTSLVSTLLMGEGQGLLRVTAEMLQGEFGGLDMNDAFVQALHRHLKISGTRGKKRAQSAVAG